MDDLQIKVCLPNRSTGTGTTHLAAERTNRATRGELASPDPSRAERGER